MYYGEKFYEKNYGFIGGFLLKILLELFSFWLILKKDYHLGQRSVS